MKKRKIWAGLSTAVLVAAPVASQGAPLPAQAQPGIEAKADQSLLHLAQHQGHAAPAATAGGEGEGEGGTAQLQPSLHLYRGIEMIRGHLLVGAELIEAGRWADAMPHFLHPEEEIYASIRDQLKTYNV